MMESLYPDFAFVKAWKSDSLGNLQFRGCTRTGNADAAVSASKTVIAEVDQIVDMGQIDPDSVHVPSIYIDRVVKSLYKKTTTEVLIMKKDFMDQKNQNSATEKLKQKIARRAAKEFSDGMHVNLGIGIPMYIPAFLPQNVHVQIQGENGVLGIGDYPETDIQVDPDFTNPGKVHYSLPVPGDIFVCPTSAISSHSQRATRSRSVPNHDQFKFQRVEGGDWIRYLPICFLGT